MPDHTSPSGTDPEAAPSIPKMTYSHAEVAKMLGISIATLFRHLRDGRIPGPTYIGTAARWPTGTVAFISTRGVQPAGTYPRIQTLRSICGSVRRPAGDGGDTCTTGQPDPDGDLAELYRRTVKTLAGRMEC